MYQHFTGLAALVLLVGIATCLLSGCATIMAPGPDKILISSVPEGARVTIDGQSSGLTPTVVKIKRSSDAVVRVDLEGYEPVTYALDKSFNTWVLGNVLWVWGLPIAVIVDAVTGNLNKIETPPLFVLHEKRG